MNDGKRLSVGLSAVEGRGRGKSLVRRFRGHFPGGKKSQNRIYEAGAGVNSWFCAEGCDGVREDVAARVLA